MVDGGVCIIAEPGSTANGDLDTMRRQVWEARACGANVFKAQWTSNPARMVQRRNAIPYLRAYGRLAFPRAWLDVLADECRAADLAFACSVYLPEDVAADLPVRFVKLASFEALDFEMLRACEAAGVATVISTGMTNSADLATLLWWRDEHPATKLLHCVSAYPALTADLNLAVIRSYALDGFSDHTCSLLTGALAVAYGADYVETHFRLDDCASDNPDFQVSLTLHQFSHYCQNIRVAERARGEGRKRLIGAEGAMLGYRVR